MAKLKLVVVMVITAVITPLLVIASAAALLIVLPGFYKVAFGISIVAGFTFTVRELREARNAAPVVTAEEAPELSAIVDRLCALGDLRRPEIVIEPRREPNSWIVAPLGRTPRLHVTRSLIELLEPGELTAVIAHELSHLANHDATVMTVVGTPGLVLQRGGSGGYNVGMALAKLIGLASRAGTNVLSRCRELSADAGAAELTGHPSALASALIKVSGAIELLPRADLRVAAARDSFNLIAVQRPVGDRGPARTKLARRLGATHPPLERRLAALHELERRRQRA